MRRILTTILLFYCFTVFGVDEPKIRIGGGPEVPFGSFFSTVMPGDTLEIEILNLKDGEPIINSSNGKYIKTDNNKWNYIAPEEPGTYFINLSQLDSDFRITVFVLRPLSEKEGEYLNGYRIGKYPSGKYKGRSNYAKPKGLIEVTKDNKDEFISPHFQLKQFLCKQESGWPKYVLVDPKVVAKLEYLIDALKDSGRDVKTIYIMSGYRTPYYNKAIGNVKYSRHIYGDAMDIYIDENLDREIDDLDNDGKSNMQDAVIIYKLLDDMDNDPKYKELLGGLGKYRKNSAHTYFVHTDTRGYKARW